MSDDQLIAPGTLDAWEEVARGDDWHRRLVGSDIRLLIGDLKRARHRLASTQPAPAFPREELDHGIERVCEAISLEFKGFWAAEDLVEELPALIRREFSALLQGKQP